MSDKKTIAKTKLIKLLSTFSALEWKRFGRFVQSPYHNSNQKVIALYTYLKKAFPFEDIKMLEQERIYKKVYGNIPFKLNNFQSCCSDLYALATDFIVDRHLQKEKRKREKILIDALSERNYELFKGASQQLIKEVETQEYFLDSDDFLLLYQINNNLHNHIEKDKFTSHQIELEKTWLHLHAFYEDIITQIEAENTGNQNFLNQKKVLESNKHNQLKNLFLKATQLHKSKQVELYFELKEKVFRNWFFLKHRHKTNLLVHLLNFSFTNELIQKDFGHKEALTLYKTGIKDKLFIINDKMRDIEFLNICMIGFKYESEAWVVNFINKHQFYLTEEVRNFLIPLVYAYNAIFQNDYERVIALLREVIPPNNLLYLDKIKELLIRAYFDALINGEEEYRSLFYHEMEAMKKSINRNKKLSTIKLEARNNFLKVIRKLLTLYDNKPNDFQKINAFQQFLTQTQPLILKSWLTEKYLQLKNAAS